MNFRTIVKTLEGDVMVFQTFSSEKERDMFYDALITGQNPILDAVCKNTLMVIKEDEYKGHWIELDRNIITK